MTGSLRGTQRQGWAGVETSLSHARLCGAATSRRDPLPGKTPPKGSCSSSGSLFWCSCRLGVRSMKLGCCMPSWGILAELSYILWSRAAVCRIRVYWVGLSALEELSYILRSRGAV